MRVGLIGFIASMLMLLAVQVPASAASGEKWDTIPDATFENLKISRDASPAELYEAVAKRYKEDYTEGKYAEYWEPIPMDMYFQPFLYYKPPNLDMEVKRGQCVQCHTGVTHGWVTSWQQSVHANLDEIRDLPSTDVRAYKKDIIKSIENNLHSQGLLDEGEKLKQVSCIDCHMGVGKMEGNHGKDLRMPDRAACGQCHVRQFAEAESEKDTQEWPQGQWPQGHPSHSVDWLANINLATWAALDNREAAASCTLCHTNQAKCDTCHTRHTFSTVESRKPQACATCHNGVDHNEYEQYMLSKHGTVYQTQGQDWNWNARLADAQDKGHYTAPTCALCHFEYKGKFTHNVTRKVRWGFLPTPDIADNLDHPWFEKRKDAWQETCSMCHSPRFAGNYLDFMDNGIKQGTDLVEETRKVVQKLYDDGLLVGQKTNRPAPPAPVEDSPGGFFSLFFSKGNGPTTVDIRFARMWEQHVARYMKGLEHVNPGGWTYSHGWSDLIGDQIYINEQNTKLRERAKLEKRVEKLEGKVTSATDGKTYNNRSGGMLMAATDDYPHLTGGGLTLLGGGLVLGGFISLKRGGDRRRRGRK